MLDLRGNRLKMIPESLLKSCNLEKIHFDGKELITMSYNEVVHLNEQGLKTWLMALANMYEIDEIHVNKLMGEEYSAMDLVHIEKKELMEVFPSFTA
mmetsp:Transcript_3502/g.5570  ORF Transcript_3502/g.5570 Transcript_3502/m.5570 type:complete len:97 (-) Transcript_3502:28-318(-)